MTSSGWRNSHGDDIRLREAAGLRVARHGRDQPSARLRRRGRDAGGRRQRHRRRHRGAVHAHRGRADDGRHLRRRHGAYPPGRRPPYRASTDSSTAPLAAGPTMYTPDLRQARPATWTRSGARTRSVRQAVAAPGNLKGWCEALARFGTLPLADVMEPAIRHASRGFAVTPLPRRMHRRCARRPGARCRDRALLSAGRLADPGRHAAGHRRLCRDAAQHRARRTRRCSTAARWARIVRRPHGKVGRLHRARRPAPAIARSSATPCAARYRGFEIVGPPPPSSGGAAHHPDAEHPGGLRHRRAGLRLAPTRCTCWPRC